MDTKEIAEAFTALCKEHKFEEAGEQFWSGDVVSIEAMPGEMQRCEGAEAVKRKGDWWTAHHEVHAFETEGPFVNGDQFAVNFRIDVTPKGQERLQMDEVGLYTVRDGKIVEERFFY